MKDQAIYRRLMIAAGILAVLTILLSPAFQQETNRVFTELKAANPVDEDRHVVSAAPDAMTTSQAVEVEPANPFIIQEIIAEGEQTVLLPSPQITLPASVLTTLLRSVISPQAP